MSMILRVGALTGLVLSNLVLLQAQEADVVRFEALDSEGVKGLRGNQLVLLELGPDVESPISIPRLAAPMRKLYWKSPSTGILKLVPEPESWVISWPSRPSGKQTLVLELGEAPKLLSEVAPVQPTGDGAIYLPAHMAATQGDKVRYEPQTFKNTVGYWTGAEDQATWKFNVGLPGTFNVAILQGCGKGQGGSSANIRIAKPGSDDALASLDFEVLETGHFQNFQWRHLGVLEIRESGTLELRIKPNQIAKNALMDVRAVHLVRLPIAKR